MPREARPRDWCQTPPWTGVTVLASIRPLVSEPSRFPPVTVPCVFPGSTLVLSLQHSSASEASPFQPGAEGKPTTAGKGRQRAEGVAHPHPSPHQLRLTEPAPIVGRKDVQDKQPCGVRLGDELCRGNGAPSPTAKTRISHKPLSLWGRAQSWSRRVEHGSAAAWPDKSEGSQ